MRSRKVICMKEEKVIPATNCDANSVPFSSETCNLQPCGDGTYLYHKEINYFLITVLFLLQTK